MAMVLNTVDAHLRGTIEEVVSHYPFQVSGITPIRNAFIIFTDSGPKCLKQADYSEGRALFIYSVLEHLRANGFNRAISFIRTKDGKPWATINGKIYYLTDWIMGREADFQNPLDLKNAAQTLAKFHLTAKGFKPPTGSSFSESWGTWLAVWEEQMKNLMKIKTEVLLKEECNSFDIIFLEYVDRYYLRGLLASQALAKSAYRELSETARRERSFCHFDFSYTNILVQGKEDYFMIDFDFCNFEMHLYDIGDFLLRSMHRGGWNMEKVNFILDAYSTMHPLNHEDKKVIFALCQYPRDFWRIVNSYYWQGQKKYTQEGYLRSLMRIVRQYEQQEKMLRVFQTDLRKQEG